MNGFDTALGLIPGRWIPACRKYAESAEEFRLRVGQPLGFLINGKEYAMTGDAISQEELLRCLEKATEASLHTASQALSKGYIRYRGLRIGVCGSAIMQEGTFTGFRSIRSIAVRIPRECRGACDDVYHKLYTAGFQNTLLISPPGMGKTTALRELIRLLSDSGIRISVADERDELSGSAADTPFDLGRCSDVMTGCGKAEASMMLLRGMNPQIIAMDEITQPEDLDAVLEIAGCGVGILASVHAESIRDLNKRSLYRKLLEEKIFHFYVGIRIENARRVYTAGVMPL